MRDPAPLSFLPRIAAVLLACVLFSAPTHAGTKKTKAEGAVAVKAKKSGKAPKFSPGSEETTRDRERRLLRECKGRVNAGACAGLTG